MYYTTIDIPEQLPTGVCVNVAKNKIRLIDIDFQNSLNATESGHFYLKVVVELNCPSFETSII